MSRRNDHSREELRSLILQSALRLLEEGGIAQLSARKIAQEIGYTVGTLYNVFTNMDELILALNAETLDMLYAGLKEEGTRIPDSQKRILAIASYYLTFATNHYHRWNTLFMHTMPKEIGVPPWYRQRIQAIFTLLEEYIRPLQPNIPTARAVKVLWASLHGICTLALNDSLGRAESEPVPVLVESLVATYLAGITS